MSKTFTGYTNIQFNGLPGWARDLILQLEQDAKQVQPKAYHVSFQRVNTRTNKVEVLLFDPVHVEGVRNQINSHVVDSVDKPFDYDFGLHRVLALELINYWNATDPQHKYWLTNAN